MSREVDAGQAFGLFFPHLKKQGISPERLVEGTGLALSAIQQRHARIDWEDFVKVMRNVGRVWTDEQLVQIGSGYFESPFMRPFSVVARLIFTAVDFYKWVFVKTMGVGNQTFSCVEATLEEPRPGQLILQLTVPERFEVAREFFVLSRGTFAGMPRILGLPRANVQIEWVARGARFTVNVPPGGGWLGRLRRFLMWPFTVRAAAQELKSAHETLTARYAELETAQGVLKSQAEELETVNAALKEYQAELEHRVDQRTAQLTQTTDQLKVALEHQKDLDRQKTEFFANASHELRTPLTLLIGPLETLSNDTTLAEAPRLELSAALRNGYRLIKLVNDVLDLSKIEAGRLNLQMGPTSLTRVLEEVLRPWGPALAKRGIRVETKFDGPVRMVADAERLEQVMLNLVSNAVKHTPDGGYLKASTGKEGDRAYFVIENSGEGIEPEDVGRIFERFGQSLQFRGRRFGSSGLGLSVVQEIVELHGGKVSVDNHPGERVAFRVELPLGGEVDEALRESVPNPSRLELAQYQSTSITEPQVAALGGEPQGPGEPSKPLLLIVEDNNELRSFLARGLSKQYQILQAPDGAQGLAAAAQYAPSIILSDLMMPVLDGIEMCKQLKAQPALAGIPVVMLTARSDLETKLLGLSGGADDFIVKPFHIEEVRARLQTQLRLRQLAARATQAEKLAALGTLVGGVAHEVRNPLNGILNALRPLRDMIPDTGDGTRELIDAALEAAERVESVSSQLLLQARAGEGSFGAVDVGDNVALAVRMLAHKVSPGPKIVCDVPADHSIQVVGEAGALNQIWINLIDNAILAAGPEGKVTVTVRNGVDTATVEVADSGPGIPAHLLGRIFDPFFTTREVGKGTGLGLAVVRDIVEKHRGQIAVQSRPGEGAKFVVTLPSLSAGEVHARG